MLELLSQTLGYSLDLDPINWSGVSAMADVFLIVINVLLLASIVLGVRSLHETKKSRDADMMTLVLEQIEPIKADMRLLAQSGTYEAWKNNDETKRAAQNISVRLQRLAYMGRTGLINQKHLIEMWGPTFVKQWQTLKPFVQDVRVNNQEPANLEDGAFSRKDFELFAAICEQYLSSNYPAVFKKNK
jgi:hypothetical protein